ncbi:TIR domain-containing protein [Micromonospora sp. b486]
MAYKKAVIVLVGQETASRPWVIYEIEKAWR